MAEILVAEGQRVRAGDQLMVIHGDPGTGKNRDRIVKATQDGVVRNLRVRAHQRVTRGDPLLQIISGEGRPFAELRLPADAIGSIAPGQGVNLALDAYPSETFGTVKARIVSISSRRIERSGTAGPLYVYRVKISAPGTMDHGPGSQAGAAAGDVGDGADHHHEASPAGMAGGSARSGHEPVIGALDFAMWRRKRIRLIRQTEAAECGLASFAMIANYHGLDVDLASLRPRLRPSFRGSTLKWLMDVADVMGFTARALRVDLDGLAGLELPAISPLEHEPFRRFGERQGWKGADPRSGRTVPLDTTGPIVRSLHRGGARTAAGAGFRAVEPAPAPSNLAIVAAGGGPRASARPNAVAEPPSRGDPVDIALLSATRDRCGHADRGPKPVVDPGAGVRSGRASECGRLVAAFIRPALRRHVDGLWHCRQCRAAAVQAAGGLVREATCRGHPVPFPIDPADPAAGNAKRRRNADRRVACSPDARRDVLLQRSPDDGRARRARAYPADPLRFLSVAA